MSPVSYELQVFEIDNTEATRTAKSPYFVPWVHPFKKITKKRTLPIKSGTTRVPAENEDPYF